MKHSLFLAVFFIGTALRAGDGLVLIESIWIEMSRSDAIELLQTDPVTIWKQARDLEEAGKASRFAEGAVTSQSGSRAIIESVVEQIYPTEFDPPELPQELHGPMIDPGLRIKTQVTATAMETRNLGLTVEVDSVIRNDGAGIDLNLAGEFVSDQGQTDIGQGHSALKQPLFHAMRSIAALRIQNGVPILVSVHEPASAEAKEETRILQFVEATILQRPLEEDAPEIIDPFSNAPLSDPPKTVPSPLPPPPSPDQVGLGFEYITIDQADLRPLLREFRETEEASADALRAAIFALVKNGAAKVEEVSYLALRDGSRGIVNSDFERIYPTELDPPEIPRELSGPISSKVDLITGSTFNAFETRGIGFVMEADVQLHETNGTIHVKLAPEIASWVRDEVIGQGKSVIELPTFDTLRLVLDAELISGQAHLLAVVSPDASEGSSDRRGVIFLRPTVF